MVIKQVSTSQNVAEFYHNESNLSLIINNNGNIGIGITNPTYKLDVSGDINITGNITNNGSTTLNNNISGNAATATYAINADNATYANYALNTTNADYATTANVAFFADTATVANSLDVNNNYEIAGLNLNNGNLIKANIIEVLTLSNNANLNIQTTGENPIIFNTNAIEKLRITSEGNIGIGITNPTYKLDVSGDINISGDFKQNGVIYKGSKWNDNETSIFYNEGFVGIGISNPNYNLEVIGTIRANSNLIVDNSINTTDYKFNNNSLFAYQPANALTYTNASNNQINANSYYLSYLTNGTLIIPATITCDALVVGAGGHGGSGAFAGGGGAGEVIYYPSLSLLAGVYNIEVGVDSATTTNRISKLKLGTTEIINAKGGGNGGYSTGLILDTESKQFPPKLYNSIIQTSPDTLNGKSCYKATITLTTENISYGSGIYEIYFSSIHSTEPNPYYIFDLDTNILSANYGSFKNNNYTNSSDGGLTTQGQNYWLAESGYKGDWIAIKLPYPIAITSYTIYKRGGAPHSRCPENFRIYGSDNGTTWVILQTITGASYDSANLFYNNIGLNANTTIYLYYAMVVNKLAGGWSGATCLNIQEWTIYGKQLIENLSSATSGGSGGGGFGNTISIQLGANAGTPFNITYSKLTNGYIGTSADGGDGGSAIPTGRYESTITGALSYYGGGGSGATSNSLPIIKTNYVDGGDGNGGLGSQGIVILKFNSEYITQFLQYTNWQKIFNINVGSGLLLNTLNNEISSIWTNNSNIIFNNTGKNIGINTSLPITALDVIGNVNISSNHNNKTYLKLNNNDTNSNSLVTLELNNGIGSGNISLFSQSSTINTSNKLLIENTIPNADIEIKNQDCSFIIKGLSGNIGIGSLNPTQKLDLGSGNIKTTGIIQASILSNNSNLIFNTNGNENMRIVSSNGFIGIGTTNPISKLDLLGNFNIQGHIIPKTDITYDLGSSNNRWKDLYLSGASINLGGLILSKSSANNLEIKDEFGNSKSIAVQNLNINSLTTSELKVNSNAILSNTTNYGLLKVIQSNINQNILEIYNNNNRLALVIDNNSNVGIGTNAPNSLLHLHKNNNNDVSIKLTDSINNLGVLFNKDSNQNLYIKNNYSTGHIFLGTNQYSETLTITPQGKIGIGTNNPIGSLDICSGNIIIPNNSQKLGIGKTNPTYNIDVDGAINANEIYKNGYNISNIISFIYDSQNATAIATLTQILDTETDKLTTFVNSNKSYLDTTVSSSYNLLRLQNDAINTSITNIADGFSTLIDSNVYFKNNMFWTSNDSKIYYNKNDNLGIGTTNPNYNLDILGELNATELFLKTINISNIFLTSNHYYYLRDYNNLLNTPFTKNDNNYYSPFGCNIGIGINNPSSIFQINTGGKLKINNNDTDFTIIGTHDTISAINNTSIVLNGTNRSSKDGSIEYITSNASHIWYIHSNNLKPSKMILDKNGNLLLNVQSPNNYAKLQINGIANIHNGNIEAVANNYMQAGSLTIGGTNYNYGGNIDGWNLNTACLLFECSNNTEIAINSIRNDNSRRVSSLAYYTSNLIEFGRDMGWGYLDSHKFKSANLFEVYLNNCHNNLKSFKLEPTSLWGDGCQDNASETDGDKYLTMRKIYIQDAHICPAISGGTASIRWGKAGGVAGGTWWETGTLNSGNFYIGNEASTINAIHIKPTGNLGIGLIDPQFKLEVASGAGSISSISYKYFNLNNNLTTSTVPINDICAKFNSSIWCANSIISSSDNRIKKEIVPINNSNALNQILNIQPVKYKYINDIEINNKDSYGFIAQDIKEIIPEAVELKEDVIPNIFKLFTKNDDIIYTNQEDFTSLLKINDYIECIFENIDNKYLIKILDINLNYIKIEITDNKIKDINKIFIIGKKINDFHILNKDYIYTLNISATQELYKLIEKQQQYINIIEEKLQKLIK